jgi:hypothetical protein
MHDAPSAGAALPAPGKDELRWRAQPLQPAAWREWFGAQLALAPNATPDRGLYVGLRLDGRVRASGMGQPPWARFAVELAPLEGEQPFEQNTCFVSNRLSKTHALCGVRDRGVIERCMLSWRH